MKPGGRKEREEKYEKEFEDRGSVEIETHIN